MLDRRFKKLDFIDDESFAKLNFLRKARFGVSFVPKVLPYNYSALRKLRATCSLLFRLRTFLLLGETKLLLRDALFACPSYLKRICKFSLKYNCPFSS